MERVALGLNCYDPTLDVSSLVKWSQEAERRGFESAFFCETIELMRDSVSALTAMALGTHRIALGCTQIVRLRSPLVMAQTLATLDEISGGRVWLAPGACTRTHAERHGLEVIDGGLTLREWVEAVRLILTGDSVSYRGNVVHFDDVALGFTPRRTAIPMFIAATSRLGLRIAGQIGDGVLLNAVCSPEYTVNALRIVRHAAEEAGKDWATFQVAQVINCSVENDHDRAIDAMRWEVAMKMAPHQVPFIARPKMRVGEPYLREEDLPIFRAAYRDGGKAKLIAAVPDSYVEGMTASGTPDEVQARLDKYRQAGVQLPVLRPAAPHQTDQLFEIFGA